MTARTPPVVKSMVLCDEVVVDTTSDKIHLFGIFNAVRPQPQPSFPFRLARLCVFLQLTDAVGEASGRVVGRKADSDHVFFGSLPHPIQFADRLQVKWVYYRLKNCRFPEPGLYLIQFIMYDDQVVAEQRLHLLG